MCIVTTTFNGCFHRDTTFARSCSCSKNSRDQVDLHPCDACVKAGRATFMKKPPPPTEDESLSKLVMDGRYLTPQSRKSLLSSALEKYPKLDGIIDDKEQTGVVHFALGYGDTKEYTEPDTTPAPVDLGQHTEWLEKEMAFTNQIRADASHKFNEAVLTKNLEREPQHAHFRQDPLEEHIITAPQWRVMAYRNMGMKPSFARRLNNLEDETTLTRKLKALGMGYSADLNGQMWHGGVSKVGGKMPALQSLFFDGRRSHKLLATNRMPIYNQRPVLRRAPPINTVWESDTESEFSAESLEQEDEFLVMAVKQGMAGQPGKPMSQMALQCAAEDAANEEMFPIEPNYISAAIPGTEETIAPKETVALLPSLLEISVSVVAESKSEDEQMSPVHPDISVYSDNDDSSPDEDMSPINPDISMYLGIKTPSMEAAPSEVGKCRRRRSSSCAMPPSLASIKESPSDEPFGRNPLNAKEPPLHKGKPSIGTMSRSPSSDSSEDCGVEMASIHSTKPLSSHSFGTHQSTPTPISAIRAAQFASRLAELRESPQSTSRYSRIDYTHRASPQSRQGSLDKAPHQLANRGILSKGSGSRSMANIKGMVRHVAKRKKPLHNGGIKGFKYKHLEGERSNEFLEGDQNG